MIIKKLKFLIYKIYIYINKFYYKIFLFGTIYHPNTRVYGRVKIFGKRSNIIIGDNCSLNEGVILSANEKIVLGRNTTLSSNVMLHTGYLIIDKIPRKHIYKPIKLGNNVWIASGVVISAGITIGDNVVVGANSVVTRDLDANYFYAGLPAKKIKRI
jgi:acetyltransferase-like isoleucine patch superfamily enzyme